MEGMSMTYIQDYYQVPAEVGRRVEYTDSKGSREGVITGNHNQYIVIWFDGDKKPAGVFHPTHGIKYLGMGVVPKRTRSQERYARYREIADCFDSFRQFLLYEKVEREAQKCGFSNVYDYQRWLNAE